MIASRDEIECRTPVFEQIVEQQAWCVRVSMRSLFRTVTYSISNWKLDQRRIPQRSRCFRQLPEHIYEVSSSRVEHLEVLSSQPTVAKRERILRDRDDCLVFAQKKPVPDTLAMRDISTSVCFVVVLVL
jgi:hypothetical protein